MRCRGIIDGIIVGTDSIVKGVQRIIKFMAFDFLKLEFGSLPPLPVPPSISRDRAGTNKNLWKMNEERLFDFVP